MDEGNGTSAPAADVATSIAEIKGRSTKFWLSPNSGINYRIRKFSQLEFSDLGVEAVLSVDIETLDRKQISMKADAGKMLQSAQKVIERGVVAPPISFDAAAIDDPKLLHISDIAEDDLLLFKEIMDFSGINFDVKKAVEGFAKNETGRE